MSFVFEVGHERELWRVREAPGKHALVIERLMVRITALPTFSAVTKRLYMTTATDDGRQFEKWVPVAYKDWTVATEWLVSSLQWHELSSVEPVQKWVEAVTAYNVTHQLHRPPYYDAQGHVARPLGQVKYCERHHYYEYGAQHCSVCTYQAEQEEKAKNEAKEAHPVLRAA